MDFLKEYFINPIIYGSGYNIFNTLVYGILAVLVLFGTLKMLEKLKIKINTEFFIGISPFILLGSLLRAMYDFNALSSFLFVTPMVYVVVWVISMGSLGASILISKNAKILYHKSMFIFGIIPCLWAASFFVSASIMPFLQVMTITGSFGILIFAMKRITRSKFLSNTNMMLILTHLFDASTTFVAVGFYGYGEEHVLAGAFMGFFGNFGIFALKIIIIPAVLYMLDRSITDSQTNNFTKICIFILGFGPGMRNMLSVMMA